MLASEMIYVMYGTTETRLLAPAAVVNAMALLANGLLLKSRRISAANELISRT